MNSLNRFLSGALGVACAGALLAENTNSMYKPAVPTPGGLSPQPYLRSVTRDDTGLTLEWQGLGGPYQVQSAPTAVMPTWENVGNPVSGTSLTVPAEDPMAIFQVVAGTPMYAGQNVCAFCHPDVHEEWQDSRHPHAIESLQELGVEDSPTCLPCHTVGYGYASGFQDLESTPEKGSVQCENCHGPAGQHVANISDPSLRPQITVASANCGGCHNYRFIHRTYDEWLSSQHTTVTPEVAARIENEGEPAMNECGVCHSSAVRLALLEQWEAAQESPDIEAQLPSREDAAYFAVGCVACHQVHAGGLRNPLASTENYSYTPAVPFAEQYDPKVQLCAQCHNERGADWRDTARPPHRSSQYNILIGRAGYDPGETDMPRTHATLERQCISCHSLGYGDGPLVQDGTYTGHSTDVDYEQCSACHGSAEIGELLRDGTQMVTKQRIEEVRGLLDFWGENEAPVELRDKYGRLAWEYTQVGRLSNPLNDPDLSGPTAEEQALIPDAIKQARLNLYLVDGDGSYGVHNGAYARYLLDVARANVEAELGQP